MIPTLRKAFNDSFTKDKYQQFLDDLNNRHPGAIDFRIAETPVFVDHAFKEKMIDACESIIDFITDPRFNELTERSIPSDDRVANEKGVCNMIAFDFGVCLNSQNELEPQLVEMQGFPSLLGFQVLLPEVQKKHFEIPPGLKQFPGSFDRDSFIKYTGEIILNGHQPENVVLLEIKPHEQKTRIDFYCTKDYWGIEPVCITEIIQEGKNLFYIREGIKTPIYRIYNRIIFDELHAKKETLGNFLDVRQDLDVEWVPHPHWFYRISKFTLPFIRHEYVPKTYFLHEIKEIPADLENYVLKPLFSFAGQGVIIDIETSDIEKITDPENWILQRKVQYADIIPTPTGPAKVEIRIIYLWKDGERRPVPAINLARLSKGKMIGVRYNLDKDWVGGSVALF